MTYVFFGTSIDIEGLGSMTLCTERNFETHDEAIRFFKDNPIVFSDAGGFKVTSFLLKSELPKKRGK